MCEVTGAVRRPCWGSHVECCGSAPHLLEHSFEPSPELGGSDWVLRRGYLPGSGCCPQLDRDTGWWWVPWEAAGHPGQTSAGRNPSWGPAAGVNFTFQSKHFPSAWSTNGFSEAWKGETILSFGFYYCNREMKLPVFSSLQGCTILNTAGCRPRVAHYLCSEQLQIISVTLCLRNDLFLHKLGLVPCDTTWRY